MIREHAVEVVVVGTHGRRGFRRLLMGSVAEALFRNSPCPVLTVGPHVSARPPRELALGRILQILRRDGGMPPSDTGS